jgi:hypothetical protein
MKTYPKQKLYMELPADKQLIRADSSGRLKLWLFWLRNPDL